MKSKSHLSIGYLPEIDGLRAFAVLFVVFYHIGWKAFRGGFIGVDIFFVISGFLMTRIIYREIQQPQSFQFLPYFAKRLRRLFPALCVTILVTLLIGFFRLSPNHFYRLCMDSVAAIFSYANVSYWSGSGYFDLGSSYKPLLHTWSLSLEEQFYLVWPPLLLGAHKYLKGKMLWFIVGVSAVSLGCAVFPNQVIAPFRVWLESIVESPDGASTAFFNVPFRIFEFGIGASLVFFECKKPRSAWMGTVFGLVGLVLIFYTSNVYSHETPFPSYRALIPCIGTALILFSGGSPFMQRLLSNGFMGHVGKLSYALYLTHWPVVVFMGYDKFGDMSLPYRAGIFFVGLVFAEVLHNFVEKPFRNGALSFPSLTPKRYLLGAGFVATLGTILCVSLATSSYRAGSVADQYQDREKAMRQIVSKECQLGPSGLKHCDTSKSQNFLILGDSHVFAAFYGLQSLLSTPRSQPMFLGYRGCNFHMKNGDLAMRISEERCERLLTAIQKNTKTLRKIDRVLLASYRPYFYHAQKETRFDLLRYLKSLNPTLKVFILGNYFQTSKNKPCSLLMAVFAKTAQECLREEHRSYYGSAEGIKTEPFYASESSEDHTYIDVINLVCPDHTECPFEVNGYPFMFDDNHLTHSFARDLYKKMADRNRTYLQQIQLLTPEFSVEQ